MTKLSSRIARAAVAVVALCATPFAFAQSPYRILVGFPAGGTIDVVAEEMKEDLGAPVVIQPPLRPAR